MSAAPESRQSPSLSAEAEAALESIPTEHIARWGVDMPLGRVSQDEFLYWLVQDSGRFSPDGPLKDWSDRIAASAYDVRDDYLNGPETVSSWTNRYGSLGASIEDQHRQGWQIGPGLLRVCFIKPLGQRDEKAVTEKPKSEAGFDRLLSFSRRSLGGVSCQNEEVVDGLFECLSKQSAYFEECDQQKIAKALGTQNIPSRSMLLTFPDQQRLFILSACMEISDFGKEVDLLGLCRELRSVLRSLKPLPGSTPSEDSEREEVAVNYGDVYFYCVIEYPDSATFRLAETGFLKHAYAQIIGQTDLGCESKLEECLPGDRLVNGLAGTEGVLLAVTTDKGGNALAKDLAWRHNDQFWGGEVFAAWLVSVYQRTAIFGLAYVTHDAGAKGIDPANLDKYVQNVMELETRWMYREFASDTVIDNVYRSFQGALDIDAMWEDIREQTEMTVRILEARRSKSASNWQTMGGFGFGALLLLVGIFGVNFKELEKDADFPMLLSADWVWMVIGVTFASALSLAFRWWAGNSLGESARWLRNRKIASFGFTVAVFGLICIFFYGVSLWAKDAFRQEPKLAKAEKPSCEAHLIVTVQPPLGCFSLESRQPALSHRQMVPVSVTATSP